MPVFQLGTKTPRFADPARIWVAPNASVIGDVSLGCDASVWFSAVIRGDNEPIVIGAGTNIQDGAVLHSDPGMPCTIGDFCTIGHAAIVHGCTIGDGSLIGMGATILNDARIGNGCLVGANALVTEGKRFPDNSLIVGAPAKAVKVLDAAAVSALRAAAENYIAKSRKYSEGLTVLSE